MYNILNPKNTFDASAFQFAKMTYLHQRVDENYQKLIAERALLPGRVNSSHLLFKILSALAVPFDGDMPKYMQQCEAAETRVVPTLKMTASYSKGRLFTEGVFYSDCPEIIISARNPRFKMMDLWTDWRAVEPVWVVNHPISDMTVIELGVMNSVSISRPDLAVIAIDIPLLAAKWRMFKSTFPDKNVEAYVSGFVLPQMMKSHLNVALFNKLMVYLGIREACLVKSNLPFAQNSANVPADQVIDEVANKLSGKTMTANQILSSIPAIYGENYLTTTGLPPMPPTAQVLWALISLKVDPASVVLAVGKAAGYDRMLHEIMVIKRGLIINREDKIFSNGLTTAAGIYLEERLTKMVTNQIPA